MRAGGQGKIDRGLRPEKLGSLDGPVRRHPGRASVHLQAEPETLTMDWAGRRLIQAAEPVGGAKGLAPPPVSAEPDLATAVGTVVGGGRGKGGSPANLCPAFTLAQ